ncbi:hypothetical protein J6O48_00070 [bacterium]|nr:hypothetical protein [bacterium]
MGLSASQARLLSLTARQSNLEYEGQQINQQRTTLSNESSNYYNSLLEMSVPVPPSTNDYTKIVYTFTIGGNSATVKEALPKKDADGNTTYLVSYTTNLSTIGIAENEAFKTSASAKNVTAKGSETPYTGSWSDDDVELGKNYFLATMNRIGSLAEANELRTKTDSKFYIQRDSYTNGDIIIGPDGYQITKDVYDAITDVNDKKECRFYQEEQDATPATATRYTLSYALIPNKSTFDDHKTQTSVDDDGNTVYTKLGDVIYQIEESSDTDAKKGVFSYKASNGENFTVVDPQYKDSFINADLDINDYYQYNASSGVRFVKREDVEGNLNSQSVTIKTSAVATIDVVKENSLSNATIEFDAQGRISTITDEEGHTYTMTATTETDNAAYDDGSQRRSQCSPNRNLFLSAALLAEGNVIFRSF